MIKYILIYLCFINLLTFVAFAVDKYKAKRNKWRIKESTLLLLSFFGGALGGLVGMYSIRHKTKTPIFVYLVPLFLILQTAIAFFAIYKGWINFN